MWAIILSDRLAVIALVGFYPTNKLIAHDPLPMRKVPEGIPTIYFRNHEIPEDHPVLAPVSRGYSSHRGKLVMYYSPLRRSTRRTSHSEEIEVQAFALDLHA